MYALKGQYQLEIHEDGERIASRSFHNLITQTGRDAFAEVPIGALLANAQVGVASTPPSDEQTRLYSQLGPQPARSSLTVGGTFGNELLTAEYVFPEGSFNNVDLQEVGIFTTQNVLFSRALLRDEVGNVISINVKNTQRLVLRYTLNVTYSTDPVRTELALAGRAGTVGITVTPLSRRYAQNGSNAAFSFGPASLDAANVTFKLVSDPLFSAPTDTVATSDSETIPAGAFVPSAYRAGSRQRQVSVKVDSDYGNKGVKGVLLSAPNLGTPVGLVLDNVLSKTKDFRLYLDFIFDWS